MLGRTGEGKEEEKAGGTFFAWDAENRDDDGEPSVILPQAPRPLKGSKRFPEGVS